VLNLQEMIEKIEKLDAILLRHGSVMVAFSGGADSAFLFYRANALLQKNCLAAIADSPSLPRHELASAIAFAKSINGQLEIIQTAELENPDYASNPSNRCFFCKKELFLAMSKLAAEKGFATLAYGENADDISQFRPGRDAAMQAGVIAPLQSAGLTKEEIRQASRDAGLPTSEKAASPCLASRVPHGMTITKKILASVEKGEALVRGMGFSVFRLRHHGNSTVLELGQEELKRWDTAAEHSLKEKILALGYSDFTVATQPYGTTQTQQLATP